MLYVDLIFQDFQDMTDKDFPFPKTSQPKILVAGTGSGVGKTSVTLGLVAAFVRRGLTVQTFKVGPDYLDPTYLKIVSSRPCYNLDGWMTDENYIKGLFGEISSEADISVIEGVMGLFDGANPLDNTGSTAEIAYFIDAPVLLVLNGHGMSRSVAALVKGFSQFEPSIRICGVIANFCGSQRHIEAIGCALEQKDLPPLLGGIPRNGFPELPSRHLGLITADNRTLNPTIISKLADAVNDCVDLDRILELSKQYDKSGGLFERINFPNSRPKKIRLGIAMDDAFHFYYPDNLSAIESQGCELVYFSPLTSKNLPPDLDGVYFGGGYPEEFLETLESNIDMLESVRSFCASGRHVYAECGGLMYLGKGVEKLDGTKHLLAGIIPIWTRMLPRLKTLGYVEVILQEDCILGNKDSRLRGHEFHYSEIVWTDAESLGQWNRPYSASYRRSGSPVAEGFNNGSILASYVHVHFASNPNCAGNFVNYLRKGFQS
jgi:cobyrinic acid a,c-diamide synthase